MQFGVVIETLINACYFQVVLGTMLLLANNIKGNVQDKNTRKYKYTLIAIAPFTFSLKTLNLPQKRLHIHNQ